MTDGKRSASIARRNSLPGARMCSWPTNSSSDRGRMRVASGAAKSVVSIPCSSSNKSRTKENTLLGRIVHLVVAGARIAFSFALRRAKLHRPLKQYSGRLLTNAAVRAVVSDTLKARGYRSQPSQ